MIELLKKNRLRRRQKDKRVYNMSSRAKDAEKFKYVNILSQQAISNIVK